MRRGVLRGADVRPVRGVCGGPGRGQHGDGLGGSVRLGGDRADGAAVAVQRPGRRVGGIVRAWGCNGPVVEEGLGLDRSSRRQIQRGLQAGGFDPGGADGLFGPRTRAAIRNWQMSRGSRATGYLDGAAAEALRTAGASSSAVAQVVRPGSTVATAAPPPASPAGTASPPVSAELDGLFWQSIMNSTNPADFEAYLQQFPTGVFRALAQNRLTTLRGPAEGAAPLPGARVGVAESPGDGRPVTGATAAFGGTAGGGDAGLRPRQVFRDCEECPEMVVVPAGSFRMGCVSGQDCDDRECPVHEVRGPSFALGRYEVLFEEYDRFVAATGRENSTTGAGAGAAVR